jgi:hypothetical protein
MRGRTGFDANQARRQVGEELQHLHTTDALTDHHRARIVDPVNLEHSLRNIETNRDNLARGRLPS